MSCNFLVIFFSYEMTKTSWFFEITVSHVLWNESSRSLCYVITCIHFELYIKKSNTNSLQYINSFFCNSISRDHFLCIVILQTQGTKRHALMLKVIHIQSAVRRSFDFINNHLIEQSTLGRYLADHWCRRPTFKKILMPKCRSTGDRHNKLSADGSTIIEDCSADYSTTTSIEGIVY